MIARALVLLCVLLAIPATLKATILQIDKSYLPIYQR